MQETTHCPIGERGPCDCLDPQYTGAKEACHCEEKRKVYEEEQHWLVTALSDIYLFIHGINDALDKETCPHCGRSSSKFWQENLGCPKCKKPNLPF